MDYKTCIREVPDFPKPGINFMDITTLVQHPEAFGCVVADFAEHYADQDIDSVVGIESRGFIFGGALAYALKKPFIIIRKPGKLPYNTVCEEYELEYGTDKIEIHEDAIERGDKVLIVDDLLATGGTSKAAANLVEKLGGVVASFAFVVELSFLNGRERISSYDVHSLVKYDGE